MKHSAFTASPDDQVANGLSDLASCEANLAIFADRGVACFEHADRQGLELLLVQALGHRALQTAERG
jgi:hypothetical protein